MPFAGLVESSREHAKSVFGKKHKFLWKHTCDVVNLCLKYGEGLDFEVLMISAYLHDLGQTVSEEDHQKIGAELAEKWLSVKGADKEFVKEVVHCISEHGKIGKPKTQEAIFLRQVDGVSLFKWNITAPIFANLVFRKKQGRKEVVKVLQDALSKISDKRLLKEAERRYKKIKFFAPGIKFKDVWLKSTIIEIARSLDKHKINYRLIGGGSLRLRGVKIDSHDIDILTNKKGAMKFQKIFESYAETPVRLVKTDAYRTWFGKFKINDFQVEVMGDLEKRDGESWKKTKYPRLAPIHLDGVKLNVMNIKGELEIYKTLGLNLDKRKLKKIEEFVNPVKL